MSNFTKWQELADMPTQDKDGSWYDAETGFPYDASVDYSQADRAPIQKVNAKAEAARKETKKLGGHALIGSLKQKNWAETIRTEILSQITNEEDKEYLAKGSLFQHSTFWIDNRDTNINKIRELPAICRELILKANTLLRDAEAQIKTDSRNIIISKGNHDELINERDKIIDKLNEIKAGNLK